MMIAPITNTIAVVCRLVEEAEKRVLQSVYDGFPGAAEEEITTLFRDKLRESFNTASEQGDVGKAFAKDLQRAGIPLDGGESIRLSRGLVVEVSWHPRHIERKTGGDFGLILVRPKIERGVDGITISRGKVTGLLAQAKRQLYSESFGPLTDNQQLILADRLEYTSLVLYGFTDFANRQLAPFGWRHCTGATIGIVNDWLAEANFPQDVLMSTTDVLRRLEGDEIGTTDRDALDSVIVPPATPTMRVEITWEQGYGPSSSSYVFVKPDTDHHVEINQSG